MAFPAAPVPSAKVAPMPKMPVPAAVQPSPLMAILHGLAAHMRGVRPGQAGGPPAQGMRAPMPAQPALPPAGVR